MKVVLDEIHQTQFVFTVLGDSGGAPVRCFFDFFIPLPSKTPTFESMSGKQLSRNALKSRCFRWEGYDKVKKTSHRSVTRVTKYRKTHLKCEKMNTSGTSGMAADRVSSAAVRTPSSTRAGGQDDMNVFVVY